jgi:hypothetical protein
MFQRIGRLWQKGPVRLGFWMAFAAVIFDAVYNSIGAPTPLDFVLRFCAWFVAAGLFVVVAIGSLFGAAFLADRLPHSRLRWIVAPLLFVTAFAFGGWLFPKLVEPVPWIGWRVTTLVHSLGEHAD